MCQGLGMKLSPGTMSSLPALLELTSQWGIQANNKQQQQQKSKHILKRSTNYGVIKKKEHYKK